MIKTKIIIPEQWKKKEVIEYSFRFHSYENWHDDNIHKERWWLATKNGPAWTCGDGDINLDIQDMLWYAEEFDISFDDMFSLCISHEMIHNLITNFVDTLASRSFDNICWRKNKNFKEWHGGMP